MERTETMSFLQSLQPLFPSNFAPFYIFFFLLFSILFICLTITRRKPRCNCEICHSYLSSSWSLHFTNLCDWYTHLLQNSPTQTIHIHVLNNIITANPVNVEHLLRTQFQNYPKGKPFSTILGDLLGKGIFNVDGDLWLFQRKIASLELGSMAVRSYAFDIVTKEIETRLLPLLADKNRNGLVLDLQDVFRRFSFDVICKFSFGLDPGCLELCLPMSQFAESFDLATKLSAERAMVPWPLIWKIQRLLGIGKEKELKRAIEKVDLLAKEVIRKRRKLGFINSGHQDLLSRFMASNLTDETFVRDIVISFILAGRDTVASTLTCFFWLVSKHPHVVVKIREESNHVMGQGRGPSTVGFDQVRNMHYLHATIYESMRLYPPIQFDSKFALGDDVLPDKTIVNKGARVMYHPYAMGRMKSIWGPDCLDFNPERWLKDGEFCPVDPFKYPVFQAGIRVCLGKEMALMQIKIIIMSVLDRFDIDVVRPRFEPMFDPSLTATIRGGVKVVVRKRGGDIGNA